jgi:hypothetical protein
VSCKKKTLDTKLPRIIKDIFDHKCEGKFHTLSIKYERNTYLWYAGRGSRDRIAY